MGKLLSHPEPGVPVLVYIKKQKDPVVGRLVQFTGGSRLWSLNHPDTTHIDETLIEGWLPLPRPNDTQLAMQEVYQSGFEKGFAKAQRLANFLVRSGVGWCGKTDLRPDAVGKAIMELDPLSSPDEPQKLKEEGEHRCPKCGRQVRYYFQHVDVSCENWGDSDPPHCEICEYHGHCKVCELSGEPNPNWKDKWA